MNRRFVYTVRWPDQKEPSGLAMDCHIWNGALRYFDMNRGHEIKGRVTEDGEEAFTFISEGFEPGPWYFEKMTIEWFRREGYKIVAGSNCILQTVHTTEELQEWYYKQFGKAAGL